MTLEQLEEKMGIEFPKGFHEIYETGAMEWLTVTREEFLKNRSQYLDNPKSFLMLPCMCEPIPFEDISMWNEELKELLKAVETITSSQLHNGGSIDAAGNGGYYWSSSLRASGPYDAYNLYFIS